MVASTIGPVACGVADGDARLDTGTSDQGVMEVGASDMGTLEAGASDMGIVGDAYGVPADTGFDAGPTDLSAPDEGVIMGDAYGVPAEAGVSEDAE